MNIHRGDIILISFDPSRGHEIKKTRPALVIQNNHACLHSPLLTVLPISSHPFQNRIFEVKIPKNQTNKLLTDSTIIINQARTIDRDRCLKKLGKITPEILKEVETKLLLHLGIAK